MFRFLILVFVCFEVSALPDGWEACSKKDPEYSDCLSKGILNAVNVLTYGDSPKLHPLIISNMEIVSKSYLTANGPVSIKLNFYDGKFFGMRHILNIETTNDWKTMHIKAFLAPKIQFHANYSGEGEIYGHRVKGQGPANVIYENLTLNIDIAWKRIKVGTTDYFNIDFLTMDMAPEKFSIVLDNFYDGVPGLAERMNNDWKVMYDELNDALSEQYATYYQLAANQFLFQFKAAEIDID